MWNDNDTNIDLIDFTHLVDGVNFISSNPDLVPCTIGLYGDWGSGKSSLLRMVEDSLEDDHDTLVVKFNGWLFEGYDDAKTAVMTTILENVASNRTLKTKGKKLLGKLMKQVDWLKLTKFGVAQGLTFAATGGIGNLISGIGNLSVDKTKIIEALQGFSEGDYDALVEKLTSGSEEKTSQMGIREFHQDFAELLSETKIKQLVVFIDDLDRCSTETVIDTLEAIKLFLYVKNSIFIISADERLIQNAVRDRFPNYSGDKKQLGREYLEKLIQFPVRIPQLSESEIETYINLLFTKLHLEEKDFNKVREKVLKNKLESIMNSGYNLDSSREILGDLWSDQIADNLLLSRQIVPILSKGIKGNPRQAKRFLNTLLLRFKMASFRNVDLEKRVLAKLMLLEYFKPEMFKSLSELQHVQEGKPTEIREIEGAESNEDLKESVSIWLTDKWLTNWVKSSPKLSGIDLRPYFFFSRDILYSFTSDITNLSPEATEIINLIMSESDVETRLGLEKVQNLNDLEVSGIFSSISELAKTEESKQKRSSILKRLCSLVNKRKELIPDLIEFVKKIPEKQLSAAIVPQLRDAVKESSLESAIHEVLDQWSKSDNKLLAKATKK